MLTKCTTRLASDFADTKANLSLRWTQNVELSQMFSICNAAAHRDFGLATHVHSCRCMLIRRCDDANSSFCLKNLSFTNDQNASATQSCCSKLFTR